MLQVRSADNDVDTNPANDNLFVTGVPVQWTEVELRNVFAPYGKILSMRMLPEMRQAMGKGGAA
jgi:RNA recognition motif-containing protein